MIHTNAVQHVYTFDLLDENGVVVVTVTSPGETPETARTRLVTDFMPRLVAVDGEPVEEEQNA